MSWGCPAPYKNRTVRDNGEEGSAERCARRLSPSPASSALGLTALAARGAVVLVAATLEALRPAGALRRLAGSALLLTLFALTHDGAPLSLARSWPYSRARAKTRRVLFVIVQYYCKVFFVF